MTDRVNGVTVTFERDIRDEAAAELISAISLIRGVARVEPHIVRAEDHFARSQAAHEFKMQLYNFIESLK